MKTKEFVRIYEDGTVAFRVSKKITKAFDPYRLREDRFNRFWRFCVIAYRCLSFNKVDRRFKPSKAFVEIPYEKAVNDFEKLYEI